MRPRHGCKQLAEDGEEREAKRSAAQTYARGRVVDDTRTVGNGRACPCGQACYHVMCVYQANACRYPLKGLRRGLAAPARLVDGGQLGVPLLRAVAAVVGAQQRQAHLAGRAGEGGRERAREGGRADGGSRTSVGGTCAGGGGGCTEAVAQASGRLCGPRAGCWADRRRLYRPGSKAACPPRLGCEKRALHGAGLCAADLAVGVEVGVVARLAAACG